MTVESTTTSKSAAEVWDPARIAAWLAASEVLPAEWHDLSTLTTALKEPLERVIAGSNSTAPLTSYDSALLSYLLDSITSERLEWWRSRLQSVDVEVGFAACTDFSYPRLLAGVYNRPPWLFFRGDNIHVDSPGVAVVGSRNMRQGLDRKVERVVGALVDRGVSVVSGLAKGVDTTAHLAALKNGGCTIGVVGSGLDAALRTRADETLLAEVERAGSILSPFPPDAPATRSSLPLRNAVISGLSIGSVIMQIDERSGTRSELDHSLAQGRPACILLSDSAELGWLKIYESSELVTLARTTLEVELVVDSWLRAKSST